MFSTGLCLGSVLGLPVSVFGPCCLTASQAHSPGEQDKAPAAATMVTVLT